MTTVRRDFILGPIVYVVPVWDFRKRCTSCQVKGDGQQVGYRLVVPAYLAESIEKYGLVPPWLLHR